MRSATGPANKNCSRALHEGTPNQLVNLFKGLTAADELAADWRITEKSTSNADYYFPEAELEAKLINFHIQENRKAHKTDEYEIEQLLLRRGQAFDVTVKFNRDYNPEIDVIALLFITGKAQFRSCWLLSSGLLVIEAAATATAVVLLVVTVVVNSQ